MKIPPCVRTSQRSRTGACGGAFCQPTRRGRMCLRACIQCPGEPAPHTVWCGNMHPLRCLPDCTSADVKKTSCRKTRYANRQQDIGTQPRLPNNHPARTRTSLVGTPPACGLEAHPPSPFTLPCRTGNLPGLRRRFASPASRTRTAGPTPPEKRAPPASPSPHRRRRTGRAARRRTGAACPRCPAPR